VLSCTKHSQEFGKHSKNIVLLVWGYATASTVISYNVASSV